MGRPASYYVDPAVEPPVLISARAHSKAVMTGDLAGTNLSYAEFHNRENTVVFWYDQLEALFGLTDGVLMHPARSALVVFESGEGFYIETRRPRDGQTVTAEVTQAPAADLVGKTLPSTLGTVPALG